MFETFFSPRQVQRVLALTVVLGTLTLAALALGLLYLIVLLLKTIVECLLEVTRTVTEILTIGGPFARLLFVFLLLFLAWRATPYVLVWLRRELACVSPLFATHAQSARENEREWSDTPASNTHRFFSTSRPLA